MKTRCYTILALLIATSSAYAVFTFDASHNLDPSQRITDLTSTTQPADFCGFASLGSILSGQFDLTNRSHTGTFVYKKIPQPNILDAGLDISSPTPTTFPLPPKQLLLLTSPPEWTDFRLIEYVHTGPHYLGFGHSAVETLDIDDIDGTRICTPTGIVLTVIGLGFIGWLRRKKTTTDPQTPRTPI
jgi:hypothetical protein